MDASRSSLQNLSNLLSLLISTAIAKCRPDIRFFKSCHRVCLLIKTWMAILSKIFKILLNALKKKTRILTGMTTMRSLRASRPNTGTTSNTRPVKSTKSSMPLTWTPGSLAVGSVLKVRSCWVSSRRVMKHTLGILRICSTKKIRCYSFQVFTTSRVSISLGCTSAWSTQLSAGTTKTWCSTQSITTIGASLNSGMGYRSHIVKTLKGLSKKNALYFSRRTPIFFSMWWLWFHRHTCNLKESNYIKPCKGKENLWLRSLDRTTGASQQA